MANHSQTKSSIEKPQLTFEVKVDIASLEKSLYCALDTRSSVVVCSSKYVVGSTFWWNILWSLALQACVPLYWFLMLSSVSWNIANLWEQFGIFSSWWPKICWSIFGQKHSWPSCGQIKAKYFLAELGLHFSSWTCLGLMFHTCTIDESIKGGCHSNKIWHKFWWQHRLVVRLSTVSLTLTWKCKKS